MKFIITKEKIEEYAKSLKLNEKADGTVINYTRNIAEFAKFLNGEEVAKEIAIEWKEGLLKRLKPTTVNSKIAALNNFLKFSESNIRINSKKIQKQDFKPAEKELKEDEYKSILQAATESGNTKMLNVLITIFSTGIRVSELEFITVENVKNLQSARTFCTNCL